MGFADVTSGVPDWTDYCAALPLLPCRASQKRDYEVLQSLRDNQARCNAGLIYPAANLYHTQCLIVDMAKACRHRCIDECAKAKFECAKAESAARAREEE